MVTDMTPPDGDAARGSDGGDDEAGGATDVPSCAPLSYRERQVLHHFSNGFTYAQTAHRMGITRSTVDTYLRRIRAKAGVVSSAELTRLAVALEVGESDARPSCTTTGGPDRPISGGPDRPAAGGPDRPAVGGPDRPASGGPQRPAAGEPDRPAAGGGRGVDLEDRERARQQR